MDKYTGGLAIGLALLVSLLLGAAIHAWWLRRQARERRRIPRRWPLSPRVLANSKERQVWRWLTRAFFGHHVMIKIPVTRFTMPRSKEQGLHWYELLTGLYCTFTVCGGDGHVIGCVDVPGRFGLAEKNQRLKRGLLSQCGIAYIVVEADKLPALSEIRTEFLGEMASMSMDRARDESAISAARVSLRNALVRQRQTRNSDLSPLSPTPDSGRGTLHSDFTAFAGELQPNSFLTPLDSREADLR
ncbi:MAG: DUF2726 domain-containing protein [Rhodoferax sp.]|nr:DUF2726 domain-containing protein [Rhodoferax sp.]